MDSITATTIHELSVPLRAWPTSKPGQDSLPFLIAHINEQKRSFRNVSEQSLEEEVQALEAGESQADNDEPLLKRLKEEPTDSKTRKEEMLAARLEILQQVSQALTESSYGLDFVSLVLSKHTPRQAEITISPFLKQHVPMGSIGAEVTQLPQESDQKRDDDSLTAVGWKMQSLNAAADSLLRSATRLEKEMGEEAKHWEKVLAIQQKGWSITRLPRERHTLGVRYGFAEAAPEFRDRGLGALRRSEDGSVYLDLGIQANHAHKLRIRIQERGQAIGSFTESGLGETTKDSVESSILQARNAIFDEELYHELYREARHLTNRGVRSTNDAILVPFEEDKQIIFDLVTPDTIVSEERKQNVPLEGHLNHDRLSKALALASKILLSHSHRQNYNRRTQPQQPLTERKPPRVIYSILRPLLALLQQQSALESLKNFLEEIAAVMKNAALGFSFQRPDKVLDIPSMLASNKATNSPLVESLANTISAPLQAQFTINFPSTSSIITYVRTHAQGTEYKVSITAAPNSPLSQTQQDSIFTSAEGVKEHILHLLTIDLVSIVTVENKRWEITSPHEGQLSTEPALNGVHQVLSLVITRRMLQIKCSGPNAGGEIFETVHEWTADTMGSRGFVAEIKNLAPMEAR
ncbi:RNA polymerase II mediator complex subunit [Trapelia coarctata]|nr:RNA polymerase II mediator complex subunit [Trapelia coarctata]